MSKDDKEALDNFFRYLFTQSGFAYTLLGEKPMVCVDYIFEFFYCPFEKNAMNSIATVYRGSKVWESVKNRFPMKKFEFICNFSEDLSLLSFILINKMMIKDIYKKNHDLLTPVFGNVNDFAKKIDQYRFKSIPQEQISLYHHAFGIILGYGNNNSRLFRERNEVKNFLKNAPINLSKLNENDAQHILQARHEFVEENRSDAEVYSSLNIEQAIQSLNNFRNNYKVTYATCRGIDLSPVDMQAFLTVENDEDTKKIKESYDSIRAQIVEILYQENFLETFLNFLTS